MKCFSLFTRCLAVAWFSHSACAAPLADFTSASYVAGNLNAQNGWSVQVQSPYDGTMAIVPGVGLNVTATTNGGTGPIAYWPTAYVFGAGKTCVNTVNFTVTETLETLLGSGGLISLHYELSKNPYGNGSPLSVNFSRIAGTSNYQMSVSGNAGGTVTGTTSLVIPGNALGLNYASGHKTSHPLQFSYRLTEGATKASWTIDATLIDLVTNNTFALNASVTGATAYYSTTLYLGIKSMRTTGSNGGVGDGISSFNILQFCPDPLASGGVGTAGLPAPWQSQDIGAVGTTGSSSHSGGVFTVAGSGADIGGTADAFRLLHRGIRGDFDLKARVVSQANTNSLAKAGVMIRSSLDANASNAMMMTTPGSGWIFQSRAANGGGSSNVAFGGSGSAPLPFWIRLNRAGNLFTGYRSVDGVNWISVGSTTISMSALVQAGLAVSSHTSGTGTATFDNVILEQPTGLGAGPGGGTVPANATLTFSEDFSSGALDRTKWSPFYTNPANINNELQVYLPEALQFPAEGGLHIVATKPAAAVQGKAYISGAMTTYGAFSQTYGYFEVKAQLPKGQGLWPAFWLLSDDQSWPPEIDVMENLGHAPDTIHTTLHWNSGGTHLSSTQSTRGTDYSAGYHTYGVSWLPQSMTFYVDGVAVHTVTGTQVPAKPAYLLLNLAVGGSWPGSPNASTPFPSVYKVAWVRAYQYNSAPVVDKATMVFGPTSLSSRNVHPGDIITISSSLKVGPTALSNPYLGMRVTGFWGTPNHSYNGLSLGACPANTTKPFSLQYTVPSLSPGAYTIWYSVNDAATNKTANLYLAERFTVLGNTQSIAPEADTYVHDASPTTNFGTATVLNAKDGTTTGWDRISYLRFPVSGTATSATLKLKVTAIGNEGTGSRSIEIRQLATDTWTETGVNWNNRPAATGTLIATINASTVGQEYSVDVTSYFNQSTADGKASFVLVQPANADRLVSFGSREDTANAPVLEVQ